VWQFRQIQTPEDGHIGPKHAVLKESEGEKIVALQTGLIYINCLICHATGCLNIELVGSPEGKRPVGRPRRRWVDKIKMDLR
jgi:hypothetical protein